MQVVTETGNLSVALTRSIEKGLIPSLLILLWFLMYLETPFWVNVTSPLILWRYFINLSWIGFKVHWERKSPIAITRVLPSWSAMADNLLTGLLWPSLMTVKAKFGNHSNFHHESKIGHNFLFNLRRSDTKS